ncbi:MAG: chorismate synthase [Elusimicrobiota bacterium]|jgi:chorismate synthase
MMRYLTAGESHGRSLTAILEGMPAGVAVTEEDIRKDLARRQKGHGRGPRMAIEADRVQITSGVRWGETLGSPITLVIENKDWEKWQKLLSVDPADRDDSKRVIKPRPGHADLVGMLKYDRRDAQDILERASARETAVRVAVGAVCRKLLEVFGIQVYSFVRELGPHHLDLSTLQSLSPKDLIAATEQSPVRCPDAGLSAKMVEEIETAKSAGDTLGGIFTVIVDGCPAGLGSHVQGDRKLCARLAGALMSIQAIKGVEIGLGFEAARQRGSQVHDEILHDPARGYYRGSNNAGGFEGGMTNGERLVLSAAMKPIATLMKPLQSVNVETKEPFKAEVIRSDVTAVPAAGVVGEAVVAFEVANALCEKFGGDSLREMKDNFDRYAAHVRKR